MSLTVARDRITTGLNTTGSLIELDRHMLQLRAARAAYLEDAAAELNRATDNLARRAAEAGIAPRCRPELKRRFLRCRDWFMAEDRGHFVCNTCKRLAA